MRLRSEVGGGDEAVDDHQMIFGLWRERGLY